MQSIEGFDDDDVMNELRAAFTAEHALQCGYCTPGMLVTARDIVTRLPDADDDRVRLELSGNLCRCTGYVGIVRAIRRVLDAHRRESDVHRSPRLPQPDPLSHERPEHEWKLSKALPCPTRATSYGPVFVTRLGS